LSTTFEIVLLLHFVSLFAALAAASIMIVCAVKIRAAKTGAEAFPWGMLAAKTPITFPIATAGLILTGGYMASKGSGAWSWSSGWVIGAILGLVFLNAEGMLIGGAHGRKLGAAMKQNGPGPLSAEIKEMANDKLGWIVAFAGPALVLGIVWNMIQGSNGKDPSLLHSLVVMVVSWAIGAAVGVWVSASYSEKAPEAAAARADG
jgi:hypothetical protein